MGTSPTDKPAEINPNPEDKIAGGVEKMAEASQLA